MKREEYSLLFDYYGGLLSEKQREVFELYHEENFSFSEIGAALGISRQAAHRLLGKATGDLRSFEERLGLLAKHMTYEKVRKEVDEKIETILKDKDRTASFEPDIFRYLKRVRKLVKGLDI